ncbi:unnamed protein product [Cutaneotrichosporon oleaginosum]
MLSSGLATRWAGRAAADARLRDVKLLRQTTARGLPAPALVPVTLAGSLLDTTTVKALAYPTPAQWDNFALECESLHPLPAPAGPARAAALQPLCRRVRGPSAPPPHVARYRFCASEVVLSSGDKEAWTAALRTPTLAHINATATRLERYVHNPSDLSCPRNINWSAPAVNVFEVLTFDEYRARLGDEMFDIQAYANCSDKNQGMFPRASSGWN